MAKATDDLPMLALIETPDIPAPTINDQARIVLLDGEAFDQFYQRMREETAKHVPDVSTDKGRREIIALARRVTTTKTAITAAAKGLTEAWRQQTAQVNAARKPIEDRLADLAAEVRKPVTDWEAAEAERVERNRATVQRIRDAATIVDEDTAASVTDRGRSIWAEEMAGDWLPHEAAEWAAAKDATVKALTTARNRLAQEEADRAELARLREAEAERLRIAEADRLAREAREADERERIRAQEVEAARIAEDERARQAEADRIAQAERDAEQRARDEAQRIADAAEAKRTYARQIIEHIKAVGLGMIDGKAYPYVMLIRELEEKITIDDALGDMQGEVAAIRDLTLVNVRAAMEKDRAAAEQRQRDETARREQEARDRQAAEDARRAKNRAHVVKVMGAAKEAIMTCGVTEDQARAIVTAIKGDLIPAVRIEF